MGDKLRLCLVKAGETLPDIAHSYGDFDAMFLRHLGELGLDTAVVSVSRGEALPAPSAVDLAIITGSPSSVTALEPWAEVLVDWTRDALAVGLPLLGVCYGHQLLAHAAGGVVEVNPRGYEVGTIEVEVLPAAAEDPLLGAVVRGARRFDAHSTHQDVVVEPPPGARVLARSELTEVQAFALGEHAWGVQFHPEFDGPIMRGYVEGRADAIRRDAERHGRDPARELERARDSIRPTPHGPRLLRRFVEAQRIGRSEKVTH